MRSFTDLLRKHFAAVAALAILLSVGLGCTRADDDWRSELGGKKLTRAKNSGSVSSRVDIYFCSNGDYAMQKQFSGFSTGGVGTLSAANEDTELGSWSVESGTLVLELQRGERHEYGISAGSSDDVIELDGVGYLVTTQNECGR